MRRLQKRSALLEEIVSSLVKSFGPEMVTEALAKASPKSVAIGESAFDTKKAHGGRALSPTVIEVLESLRATEPSRHQILEEFYDRLKSRSVLAESQDIRQFAQMVGLKYVDGKSRREMTAALLRSLVSVDINLLKSSVLQADQISDAQRKRGFSVLTDKLVSKE